MMSPKGCLPPPIGWLEARASARGKVDVWGGRSCALKGVRHPRGSPETWRPDMTPRPARFPGARTTDENPTWNQTMTLLFQRHSFQSEVSSSVFQTITGPWGCRKSQGQGAGCRQEGVGRRAEPCSRASTVGTSLHVLPELEEGAKRRGAPCGLTRDPPSPRSPLPCRMCRK